MTIRAHVAAVRLMLTNVAGLSVYSDDEISRDPTTGLRVIPATPYVVVYSDMGRGESPRMSGYMSGREWAVATLYVGATEGEARWAAEKTQAALEGKRPSIVGRRCTGLVQQSSTTVVADHDVSPTLYLATDVWRYASTAVAA